MHHIISILAAGCLFISGSITAGGSPETTLLVVNADSPLSLTVANTYVRLREIPQNHVVWLHDIPSLNSISMKTFREQIWAPIRQFMSKQGLDDHIDTIVYSADFPYAVELKRELKRHDIKRHRFIGGAASLTGLTFFARQVENDRLYYLSLYPNEYYRRDLSQKNKLAQVMTNEDEKQYKEARKALRQKEYQTAHNIFQSLTKKYPESSAILLMLAETQTRLERRDQAIDSLRQLEALGFKNSLKLRNSRYLKKLRKDPEFKRIMQRMDTPSSRFEPPHGFRSRYHWTRYSLNLSNNSPDRYYLSAMLSYTGQRGNSLAEIEHYLERSAKSDGSHPQGTVYMLENGNIRTETRQPWYGESCALLKEIGHRCEILSRGKGSKRGILPQNRRDIIGLVTGAKWFDWEASNSELLPGAIADSFTSYGGHFNKPKQTKLTEFLRQGASGSSGAVTEPYSFAEKFPSPLMHYYYARGCSLAEAWYQAVASPYQAILIGDPLTRPFADFTEVKLIYPNPASTWQGVVHIKADTTNANQNAISHLELWIDGLPITEAKPGESLKWDTRSADDGYHDLRLIAVDAGPIETRTYIRHSVRILNRVSDFKIQAGKTESTFHEPIVLTGNAQDDALIEVYQGARKLGSDKVRNGQWEIDIPTEPLGMGRISLSIIATLANGNRIRSEPHLVKIKAASNSLPVTILSHNYHGLTATLQYKGQNIEYRKIENLDGRFRAWTRKKPPLEKILIQGQFRVDSSGFYQMTINAREKFLILVDEQVFSTDAPTKQYGLVYVPLFLEKGWHSLSIEPSPKGLEKLTILLSGGQTPMILGGNKVRNSKVIPQTTAITFE